MNCQGLAGGLHAYVDRELPVADTAVADAHVAGCGPCAAAVGRERHFRQPASFRGHRYALDESTAYRSVAWTDGSTFFGLVSALDYDALLECADRLRAERARHTRL